MVKHLENTSLKPSTAPKTKKYRVSLGEGVWWDLSPGRGRIDAKVQKRERVGYTLKVWGSHR